MLTALTAVRIAKEHGFDILNGSWEKSFIRDHLTQAREAAGNHASNKTAEQYFTGYMASMAAEYFYEASKGTEHNRNAY